MELGAFSVSLAVKDLPRSRAFYEHLGFSKVGGDGENYLILKNGTTIIGLFQGMFENNILTFNPGWDSEQKTVEGFTDVREIEKKLVAAGIEVKAAKTSGTGPGHLSVVDPDGNALLIDQHV